VLSRHTVHWTNTTQEHHSTSFTENISGTAGPQRLSKEQALALGMRKDEAYKTAQAEVFDMPHFLYCMRDILQNSAQHTEAESELLSKIQLAATRTSSLYQLKQSDEMKGAEGLTKQLVVNQRLLTEEIANSPIIKNAVLAYQEVMYQVRDSFQAPAQTEPNEQQHRVSQLQKAILHSIGKSFADHSELFKALPRQKYYVRTQTPIQKVIGKTLEHIRDTLREYNPSDKNSPVCSNIQMKTHPSYKTLFRAVEEYRASESELSNSVQLLALKRAREHSSASIPEEDLFQEAMMGAMKAASVYDHTRGFAFTTCAEKWIKQKIMRFIQDNAETIRIPQWLKGQQNKLGGLVESFERVNERKPTTEELYSLAEEVGISKDSVRLILTSGVLSIDCDAFDVNNIPDVSQMKPCENASFHEELERA